MDDILVKLAGLKRALEVKTHFIYAEIVEEAAECIKSLRSIVRELPVYKTQCGDEYD